MYGWRARIGFVFPSRGDTLLYEFYRIAPDGVVAVPYIANLRELEDSEFSRVRDVYGAAVEQLDWEGVDLSCVTGTPPWVSRGLEGYSELLEDLQARTSRPITTGPQVELEAMAAAGMTAPTVVTPHQETLQGQILDFFRHYGVSPKNVHGFGIRAAYEISLIHDRDIYRQTVDLERSEGVGDGVHFTCPRWATAGIIKPLEDVLGVPVTSSAQAIIWNALERLNLVPANASERWGSLYGRSIGGSGLS